MIRRQKGEAGQARTMRVAMLTPRACDTMTDAAAFPVAWCREANDQADLSSLKAPYPGSRDITGRNVDAMLPESFWTRCFSGCGNSNPTKAVTCEVHHSRGAHSWPIATNGLTLPHRTPNLIPSSLRPIEPLYPKLLHLRVSP